MKVKVTFALDVFRYRQLSSDCHEIWHALFSSRTTGNVNRKREIQNYCIVLPLKYHNSLQSAKEILTATLN